MKKTKCNIILYIVMFLCAGMITFLACRQSNQAVRSMPLPLSFEGEFSQNGGEWKPLSKETEFSSYEGDLVLRGRFDVELLEMASINCHLEHIGISVYINGENVYESSFEMYPDMCGNGWGTWIIPEGAADKEIEIHLHNPHSYGNPDAYNEFLNSLYTGNEIVVAEYIKKYNSPYRIVGIFIIVTSIALLGTAIGYILLRLPNSTFMLKLGIMSILMGVYIFLDTKDIFFVNDRIVFNTYICQLSVMFAAWILGMCIIDLLKEKRKRVAEVVVYIHAFSNLVLMAIVFSGVMGIYDTGMYWAIAQGIVSLLLLVLCIMEIKEHGIKKQMLLISGMILLAILAVELLNAYVGWWQNGICIKFVYVLLFVVWIVNAVYTIAKHHQASIKAEKLKEELKSRRVVLAMSQIKTHFIFNVLNAISGLCESDPQKADKTLDTFARYLRNNINVMNDDELEDFTSTLKNLEDYIELQQVRFGNKVQFEKNIEAEDFKIPSLILQPVVENSIKHGLLHKKQGGTVRLHTWTENGNNRIEISDDGVGFDTESTPREGSVGMKNVRFRLQHMVNGTMDIKSIPGEGTTVTITIPFTEKQNVV